MRRLLALAALMLGAGRASSQTRPADSTKAQTPQPQDSAQLRTEIAQHRAQGDSILPDADHFTFGDRAITAHTAVDGPIAVAHGTLDVFGTVNGDVFTVDGNIKVHSGAHITGDALAVGGSVIIDGGSVDGGMRAIAVGRPTLPALPPASPKQPLGTTESVKLVIAWFALFAIIGIGVMVFADANLDGVVIALERDIGRSFWLGLGGQVVMLPALLMLVVGLAITVLGALLIPFAIVAYVIAIAGLVTLGLLAVSRLIGRALTSDRGTTSPRGVHLRALFMGLLLFLGVWMLAALFAWSPVAGAFLRAAAFTITWVAATVGLGAALSSRAGTKRPGVGQTDSKTDELAWQTPTPVSGVAAASRRVASAK